MYPCLLAYLLAIVVGKKSFNKMKKMMQHIREQEFVVARILNDIPDRQRGNI